DVDDGHDFDTRRRSRFEFQGRNRLRRTPGVVPIDIEKSHVKAVNAGLRKTLKSRLRRPPLCLPVIERPAGTSAAEKLRPKNDRYDDGDDYRRRKNDTEDANEMSIPHQAASLYKKVFRTIDPCRLTIDNHDNVSRRHHDCCSERISIEIRKV